VFLPVATGANDTEPGGNVMADPKDGCVKPSKGPMMAETHKSNGGAPANNQKEDIKMLARVGKPAPDFELSAYQDGGFRNVKLSDYKGKWIVICFYPGDFTFV
jgi:hypothetical protein